MSKTIRYQQGNGEGGAAHYKRRVAQAAAARKIPAGQHKIARSTEKQRLRQEYR
jgi:hypothetical protein